ncbi:MAG TPA: hypothetical protein VK619_12045 [Pyrinomonadaceae bacterium]|nr:hypothetical protein [Pyrinomonadaceae bacterium]
MRRVLLNSLLCMIALSIAGTAFGQTTAQTQGAGQTSASAAQNRVVGEVTAVDVAGGEVTLKTDDGHAVKVSTDTRTAVLRVRPGETRSENAEHITLADVKVGDRIFARGQISTDGSSVAARQLVITSATAVAQAQDQNREDWRRRGVSGRITALNPSTKEITVEARSREGVQTVTVNAANVKLLRYAPDSADASFATPASFAELKVGDQIRARGDRSTDGSHFTAEEIIIGSFIRTGGTVTAINPAANEVTIKNDQTGNTLTVKIGQRSTLRRITPEMAAQLAQQRAQAEQQRAAQNGGANAQQGRGGRGDNAGAGRAGSGGGQRGGAGGRNFQQMFESLPAITLADLKKGDVVFVVASAGADATHATAVTLVTGDADFITRLLRFQGRPQRGPNSPGLPGDVVGGGTSPREQP